MYQQWVLWAKQAVAKMKILEVLEKQAVMKKVIFENENIPLTWSLVPFQSG